MQQKEVDKKKRNTTHTKNKGAQKKKESPCHAQQTVCLMCGIVLNIHVFRAVASECMFVLLCHNIRCHGVEVGVTCKYDWRCVVGSIQAFFFFFFLCLAFLFFRLFTLSAMHLEHCVCLNVAHYIHTNIGIPHVLDFASSMAWHVVVNTAVGYCVTAIRGYGVAAVTAAVSVAVVAAAAAV